MKKLKNRLILSSVALLAIFGMVGMEAQKALAFSFTPGIVIADGNPGSPCLLPDGQGGQYQDDGRTCCPNNTQPGSSCLFAKYINPLIDLMAALTGIAITIGIIWGGLEYIMSEGDPQKAASGKKRITNALFALAAFLLLYGFLQFIIPGGVLNG